MPKFLTMRRDNTQRAAQIERLVILIILRFLREKIKVLVQQPPKPCQQHSS